MLGAAASFQIVTGKQPPKALNLLIYKNIGVTVKLKSSINSKKI